MTTIQSLARRSKRPTITAVGHVALTVRDLAVSAPWYSALLGAGPVLDEDTGPFRHAVFALGDTLLGLHQFAEGFHDEPHTPRRPGLDHVAFAVRDRWELAAWAARLEAMGIEHGGIVDAHYGSALSFKDPDGLPLELFAPPGS